MKIYSQSSILHIECFNLTQIRRNIGKKLNPLQKYLSSPFLKLKLKIEKVKNGKTTTESQTTCKIL